MPGTITDDKRARNEVLGSNAAGRYENSDRPAFAGERSDVNASAPGRKRQYKNHFSNVLTVGLACSFLIASADRVYAGYISFGRSCFNCDNCGRLLESCESGALVEGICQGSARQSITGWHGDWYSHFNTGDYIDEIWYYFLDEGQYYYLDRAQYKLLGGENYILGHPCYPKLFERRSEYAVGFTNSGLTHWFSDFWGLRFISKSVRLSNYAGYPLNSAYIWCGGPLPVSRYVIWNCCFNTGDNIDKWKYDYLDRGRYNILDEVQYKWLGGMAYLFETTHSRGWYGFCSQPDYDIANRQDLRCSLTDLLVEDLKANPSVLEQTLPEPSVPEPATIAFLGLGGLGLWILKNKK